MKKILVLMLFCSIFVLGCNKQQKEIEDALELGTIQYEAQNFDASLKTFTTAINKFPHVPRLYVGRAYTEIELGDFDGALKDINEAIDLSQEAWIYAERGNFYMIKEDMELALKDYKTALSKDPTMDWVKKKIKDLESK